MLEWSSAFVTPKLTLKNKVLDLVTPASLKPQLERTGIYIYYLVYKRMTPHNSTYPLLSTDNAHALCIYINYRVILTKYLPLWLIVSEECWQFSVSFPWSSWQTCVQITKKINDYQELQRNLEPQRQTPHMLELGTPETNSPRAVQHCGPADAKGNQTDEWYCLSRCLSQHTCLQSPTLQEPVHKRGWAHVTSICQMNPGPCNEPVQQCNPPQEAFWDHT